MQDIFYQETDQISLTTKNTYYGITLVPKVSPLYVFEEERCYERIPIFEKNKVHFVDTFSRRQFFYDTAVSCGSENSHNVVKTNPDENKYYLLPPHTCKHFLKFHQKALELLRAIPTSIYNRSAYTLNPTFNTTYVHNNFANYSQKWKQYNDEP